MATGGGNNVLSVTSLGFSNNNYYFGAFGTAATPTTLTINTPFTGNGFTYLSTSAVGGTIVVAGQNNFNGGALTIAGNVQLGIDNWMGTIASPTFLSPNGIAISGTLDLNGHPLVVPIMTNNPFAGSGTITNTSLTPATLTFQGETPGGNNNFSNAPFVGNINNGASSTAVVKTGPQAMLLAGGGNFSGGLNVLNGALVLGSDTAQGGNTTVNLGDTSSANGVENAALLFGTAATFGMPGLYYPSTLNINVQAGNSGIATIGVDTGNQNGFATTFNGSVTLGKNAYITGDFNERTSGRLSPLAACAIQQ